MIGWRRLFALAALTAALLPRPTFAQEAATAVITGPAPGAVVAGVVAITGSALHPQFQRYELAFSFSPNPTGTWFTLGGPGLAGVSDGRLGEWDTRGIADGTYALRLRVFWSAQDYVETVLEGVRVQNAAPSATPSPAPSATPSPTGTTPPAEPPALGTQPMIDLPGTATTPPTLGAAASAGRPEVAGPGLDTRAAGRAFGAGVKGTIGVFALLGLYAGLRAAWRTRRRGRMR